MLAIPLLHKFISIKSYSYVLSNETVSSIFLFLLLYICSRFIITLSSNNESYLYLLCVCAKLLCVNNFGNEETDSPI